MNTNAIVSDPTPPVVVRVREYEFSLLGKTLPLVISVYPHLGDKDKWEDARKRWVFAFKRLNLTTYVREEHVLSWTFTDTEREYVTGKTLLERYRTLVEARKEDKAHAAP